MAQRKSLAHCSASEHWLPELPSLQTPVLALAYDLPHLLLAQSPPL
jgi:hypothetical protein